MRVWERRVPPGAVPSAYRTPAMVFRKPLGSADEAAVEGIHAATEDYLGSPRG